MSFFLKFDFDLIIFSLCVSIWKNTSVFVETERQRYRRRKSARDGLYSMQYLIRIIVARKLYFLI